MSTNFPSSLDNFTNPTPANNLNDPGVLHTDQHANANDAIEAIEAWVGISGTAATASHEYRINDLEMGGFQRNLSRNITLVDGKSLVVSEYINLNSYILDLQGDAALHIL